ncbi:purine-binding chemotaxis protein CheW [Altererythrobacter atlanticus]|uniref:CheW-like domain protein n=1 Tax=Croceibacterium atlanticum TaxID=1267766 RepID=A0A0F7KVH9_9SPHN|nr:chemotaxis protein CheW [Croceibacterium atlanticum]AKH43674.1 CheW-like domain protein [Croceibacterium atlanticum]MBB5733842.1 purine-binding chemotaxis protein CheW [Croceibacterium atlanticum]
MSAKFLVVELAGRRAVMAASAIDSVIELEHSVPVPGAPDHIAGLAALRSRPLTVISCRKAIGLGDDESCRSSRAVVVDQENHFYGLLVDEADEIVAALADPVPLRVDPGEGWRHACRSMVETESGLLPLLDIPTIIDGPGEGPLGKFLDNEINLHRGQ